MYLGLALSAAIPARAAARQSNSEGLRVLVGEITDSYCAKNGSHDDMMDQMKSMGRDKRTCTIKCLELGAKLVFYDPVRHVVYKLDNQGKVLPFAGERVRIRGRVQKNELTIETIESIH